MPKRMKKASIVKTHEAKSLLITAHRSVDLQSPRESTKNPGYNQRVQLAVFNKIFSTRG